MKTLITILCLLAMVNINAQTINNSEPKTKKVTLLWESNIPSAPFGAMLFLHTKELSFFVDIKSNWQLSGEVKGDYRDESASTSSVITWQNGASYTRTYYNINTYSAESYHKKIFDIGVAKNFKKLTIYAGAGLYRLKTEHMVQTVTGTYEYTHYAYLGYDVTTSPEFSTTYDVVKVDYTNTLNITSGIIYNAGHFSLGCGFDTNPAGLNLMMGFNF